jgi:hypothetical protein
MFDWLKSAVILRVNMTARRSERMRMRMMVRA